MSFFHWCMRYGAAILFVIAALQLVLGLAVLIQTYGAMSGGGRGFVTDAGSPGVPMVLLLQALVGVISGAAFPFFGALVIHRLDRRQRTDPRQAEPFE